ncbi:acyl-CoA dehydrogenase family protein [Mycolicibacterium cosmeticum]|uniref:acyl-CoA dehydrogenase family protein n=1 Tax=Mycolicibacterium cosmeticum TaxID=258533 RepID=UPI003204EC01
MNAPDLTRTTAPAVDADLSAMMDAVFADYQAGSAERVPGRRATLDRALWRRLDDLGLVRLTGAEASGGSGAGWREAAELLSCAVRHGVRVPLAEHDLLANWLWEAVTGDSGDDCVRTVCVLPRDGHAEVPVPWAGEVDRVVVVWPSGPEYRVADLATTALAIGPKTNLIGEPRDVVVVDPTPHNGHPVSPALVTQLKQKAALVRAVQVCAALDRAVQMSVEHVSTRLQFGRPLAKFQAIQNLVSDAAAQAALARSATEAALNMAIETDWKSPYLAFQIAVARSCAGHAASVVTRNSHQVHGAIGTTHEHRLPEFTRAALAWRSEFGSVHFWDGQVAAAAMAAGQKGLWELIAAGS